MSPCTRLVDHRCGHCGLMAASSISPFARAAFEAAVAKYPGKRIFLHDKAHVIRRYDESEP